MLRLADVERHHAARDGGFRLCIQRLDIAPGERITVLGPSGSGKTSLLDLLALVAAPAAAGQFIFTPAGVAADLAALWHRRDRRGLSHLRARYLGYVLQTGGLLPYLSLSENILLSRRLLGYSGPGPLAELAEAAGLTPWLGRRPAELSVGQRQRAAILRALAHEPMLVLADEPTAALDRGLALQITDLLVAATARLGAALVLVTHDADMAARAGGRVLHCRPCPDAPTAQSDLVESTP